MGAWSEHRKSNHSPGCSGAMRPDIRFFALRDLVGCRLTTPM